MAHPTTLGLQRQLESMYGAHLSVDVCKRGDMHILQFGLTIPNDTFLPGTTNLLQQSINFLCDVLLNPYKEQGAFSFSFVQAEKQNLRRHIESLPNDKGAYCTQKLLEKMYPGDPFSLFLYGRVQDLEAITPGDLYEHYQNVLRRCPIDCYVVGDVDGQQVADKINSVFAKLSFKTPVSETLIPVADIPRGNVEKVRYHSESMDVYQGRLNMGFRTYTTARDAEYPAMLLYDGLLGGFPHSKLFREVREKHSLAYSCSSRMDTSKGLLMVQAGVDFANVKKAEGIVMEQLEALRQGQINEEEWGQTKAMLANRWTEAQDSPFGMIQFHYQTLLNGTEWTPPSLWESLEGLHRPAVQEIADRVQLDTVYVLQRGVM